MQAIITRRNFRQEYNLLLQEANELRLQNIRIKKEMMKLMDMFKNRQNVDIFKQRV